MPPLHFYFTKSIDYLALMEEHFRPPTLEVQKCRNECANPIPESANLIPDQQHCLAKCSPNDTSPQVVAKLVLAPKGDPVAGIVFTYASREKLSIQDMEEQELMLVTSVDTGDKELVDLKVVDITVQDMLTPHARLDGKTVCETVGALTNQTLTTIDYLVNGQSNPRFVAQECVDIHARVKLGKVMGDNAQDIINLLDDQHYETFCSNTDYDPIRGDGPEECQVLEPWMKAGPDDDEPRSICKIIRGRFFSTKCGVDTEQRDRIKAHVRKKINDCFAEMGCVYNDRKFMRRHTTGNFPTGSVPTNVCCKRSLKAVAKAALRMDRLYEIIGAMPVTEQVAMVKNTTMSDEQKSIFIKSIQHSHAMGETFVQQLKMDRPTEIIVGTFSLMVREGIMQEFDIFIKLGTMAPTSDPEALKGLAEITGSPEKASRIMTFLKDAAAGVAKFILETARLLGQAVMYFAKQGFNLMSWIFHNPTTCMWLTYSALYFKKKCCELVSLKVYGDPEMVQVGLFEKTQEAYNYYGPEYASFIKKTFLKHMYDFLGSSGFGGYLDRVLLIVEAGILTVIGMIPVYGLPLAATIKASGGLTIVMQGVGSVMAEATHYAFTALVIKEAGTDMFVLLTGTCIAPPAVLKKLTASGIYQEGALAANRLYEGGALAANRVYEGFTVAVASEKNSNFYEYIASMTKQLV